MSTGRTPRVYRLLLRLLPQRFRQRYAQDMEALLRERLKTPSVMRRANAWCAAIWDIAKNAVTLRARRSNGPAAHGSTGETAGRWEDFRFALRALRRRPGFTAVAVGMLAAGIGGATTVYTVVHGVLLQPLPYAAAERIGILWHDLGDGAQTLPALNALDLYDYREWSEVFEAFTLAGGDEEILGGADDAQLVDVGEVEAGFFEFFGIQPAYGRTPAPEDDEPGSAPVAVLSHRLWEQRYGSDRDVVGRTIELDGDIYRVIGVLPSQFRLHLPAEAFRLRDAEIWRPLRVDRGNLPPRNFTGFTAFGRIRPGATFEQAQADLDRMEARLKEIHPVHAASNLQVRVVPLHADVVKGARSTLVVLFAAVALMLLVACANVANLLLVRSRSRHAELAIRSALGAARGRIVRLVLIESAVLAALGAGLGLALAAPALSTVRSLGRASLPRLNDITLDGSVILFTTAVAALAALAAGLFPALRASDGRSGSVLTGGERAGRSLADARFRDGLVLAEVGMSVVLLVGAGLMLRSFAALQRVDPGYDTAGTLTFRVTLSDAGFPDDTSEARFFDELERHLAGLPGAESVAAISQLPLTGSGTLQPYAYDDETATNWESVTADERRVTPRFFESIGATLLSGREFVRTDASSGRQVIIVDDRLAARAFPGADAVGRTLQVESNDAPEDERYAEIIGVVSHLRLHDLAQPYLTQIYSLMGNEDQYSVVLKTSVPPEQLGATVGAAVTALGPRVVFEDLRSMESLKGDALAPARITLLLLGLFGAVALAMAAVGLYSVLTYIVRQQSREIGIRLALGQGPRDVGRMVLLRGMRVVLLAMAIGVVLSALVGNLASSFLYGVRPTDPMTYATAIGVLTVAALVASWLPARRAARIDPVDMLRAE